MAVLEKINGAALPSAVNFFDNERLLSSAFDFGPDLFDFDGDLFDLNGGTLAIPNVNIIENETDYKVDFLAPGFDHVNIKVEIQDGVLNIQSEKAGEKKEEKRKFNRIEFPFNTFCTSFTLPENLIINEIDAEYGNGILHLTLPKKGVTISKPAKQINLLKKF